MGQPSTLAPWLVEAVAAFRAAFGARRYVKVIIRDPYDPSAEMIYHLADEPGPSPPAELPANLSPLERQILQTVTQQPIHAKKLAALLGRPLNSYFREALRRLQLREPPLVQHVLHGYRRLQ